MAKDFVFISYRRDDHESARSLHESLERRFGSAKVWLDVDDIPTGEEWNQHLKAHVGRCSAFITVIGRGWAERIPDLHGPDCKVREELEWALAREKTEDLKIISCLFHDTQMPTADQLPPSLSRLPELQSLSLPHEHYTTLIDSQLVPSLSSAIGPPLEHVSRLRRFLRFLAGAVISIGSYTLTFAAALFAFHEFYEKATCADVFLFCVIGPAEFVILFTLAFLIVAVPLWWMRRRRRATA